MSVVKVTLTYSSSAAIVPEKRYDLHQTIGTIKQNLATHFPTPPDQMKLRLIDDRGVTVEQDMSDDSRPLGYYQCRDGYTIHVIDMQPVALQQNFDDVSQVKKFEISEEAYAQRPDNVRAFKERMMAAMGKSAEGDASSALTDESFKEEAEAMAVGNRCQCKPGDRLGTVRYVGRVGDLKPGYWIGVEFDEPVGKGDGSVKGRRVFECEPLYGGFLRPAQVEVGDFPPEEF